MRYTNAGLAVYPWTEIGTYIKTDTSKKHHIICLIDQIMEEILGTNFWAVRILSFNIICHITRTCDWSAQNLRSLSYSLSWRFSIINRISVVSFNEIQWIRSSVLCAILLNHNDSRFSTPQRNQSEPTSLTLSIYILYPVTDPLTR